MAACAIARAASHSAAKAGYLVRRRVKRAVAAECRTRRADIAGMRNRRRKYSFSSYCARESGRAMTPPHLSREILHCKGVGHGFPPTPRNAEPLTALRPNGGRSTPYPATSTTRSKSLASCRSASCLAGSPNTRFTRLPRWTAVRAPIWSVQRARFLYASIPRNSRAL